MSMNNNNQTTFSRKEYNKKWHSANKEKCKERSKAWRTQNKEKCKLHSKKSYERNKKARSECSKVWRAKNKEKCKVQRVNWRKKNREKSNAASENWKKKKAKEDPLFAAKKKLRNCVASAFWRIKKNKPASTLTLLGCTWEEAKAHIESLFQEGMSWDNHGIEINNWHIDHIRPVADFKEEELHIMNHISNLQPLWAKENIAKSDSI